jgi:hypothetical protein
LPCSTGRVRRSTVGARLLALLAVLAVVSVCLPRSWRVARASPAWTHCRAHAGGLPACEGR